MTVIAEIVTFRTLHGPDLAAVRGAATAIGPWLSRQPGFIARSLSRSEAGLWTDHVLWATQEAAVQAGEAFMAEPSTAAFVAMIDPASVEVAHAAVLLRQTA